MTTETRYEVQALDEATGTWGAEYVGTGETDFETREEADATILGLIDDLGFLIYDDDRTAWSTETLRVAEIIEPIKDLRDMSGPELSARARRFTGKLDRMPHGSDETEKVIELRRETMREMASRDI